MKFHRNQSFHWWYAFKLFLKLEMYIYKDMQATSVNSDYYVTFTGNKQIQEHKAPWNLRSQDQIR